MCKYFLIYILLIKYQNTFFKKSNIYVKKYKKKIYTILRSPYRHKLARHQIHINRYNINHSILIKCKPIRFGNWYKLLNFLFFLKKINKIFESNLIFVNSIKMFIPFSFKNNFKLNNFSKNF